MINMQVGRSLRWLDDAFPGGDQDIEERLLRFGEEALELQQAGGITREQAHALVDQVHDKEPGDPYKELGGVLVTIACYCALADLDPDSAFDTEFDRIEQPGMIEKIRAKHATKAVVSSRFRS